jgi:hypothetical protein
MAEAMLDLVKDETERIDSPLPGGTFSNFAELRAAFPTARRVVNSRCSTSEETTFIDRRDSLQSTKIYIRAVLTRAEYDEGHWKE